MAKRNRREAREAAFVLLFEWSFREDELLGAIIEQAELCRGLNAGDFTRKLAGTTIENYVWIDSQIELHSEKWKLGRLSRVTLTVLRMAICELALMEGVPAGAAINEAVELMKKYATSDEAAYVNGVLGAFYRQTQQEKAPGENRE